MFNTFPEARLAKRLYGAIPGEQVVGFGFENTRSDGTRFRKNTNIIEPFILYSGRLEGAKNVHLLIQYFVEYKRQHEQPLKLILMGTGPEQIPNHPDIISLGFKQGQEKLDAYAAATMLCQPSVNESFSIVIMESWLCDTPVIVHADCEVTRYGATQSNGGLYFRDSDEFKAVVDLLLEDEPLRRRLAENGKRFVQSNYSWDAVLTRFDSALTHWNTLRKS